MTSTTYYTPTPSELDRVTVEAIAALGAGNSRSVYDWIADNARIDGAHYSVSPKLCGQSLKRNAEAGRVIRHGKNSASRHTLPSA
jgi:hypothetical protein